MTDREVSFTVKVQQIGQAAVDQLTSSTQKLISSMFSLKDVIGTAAAAFGAFKLAEVIKDIVSLGVATDATFRQISALLPTFTEGLSKLKDEIGDLAQTSGRSVEEMEKTAVSIAQMGVSGAEELRQQLQAATLLSDATGNDLTESAQLLIQLRREFHLTGDEALDTAAKIFSVAKGKIGVSELMSAFQASVPIFEKYKISAEEGIKVIEALVENGFTTSRAIRGRLGEIPEDQFAKIAAQVHIASDAMDDLKKSSAEVEDGVGRTATKIRDQLVEAMKSLWSGVQPLANGILHLISAGLHDIAQAARDFGFIRPAIDPSAFAPGTVVQLPDPGKIHDASPNLGPTKTQVQQAQEAAKKLRELGDAAHALSLETADAAPKSVQFAEAIAKWKEQAIAAKLPTADIAATMQKFGEQLTGIQVAEQWKVAAEGAKNLAADTKTATDAWRQLGEGFTQAADPIQQLDKTWTDFKAKMDAARATITNNLAETDVEGQQAVFDKWDSDLDKLHEKYLGLRAAIQETLDTESLISQINARISAGASWDQINKDVGDLMAKEDELKQKIAAANDPEKAQQYRTELEKIEEEIKRLMPAWVGVSQKVEDSNKKVSELVDKWLGVGRAVIGAAQAMGQLNDKTAAALQNVLTLGEGIKDIFTGNKVQGVAEATASLGGLIASLIPKHETTEERASREQAVTDALNHLSSLLDGGNTLADRLAAAQSDFAGKRQTIESSLAGKAHEAERNAALEKLNILEGQRLEQIAQEYAIEQKQLEQDYQVGLLKALGYTAEADALEFNEQQQRAFAAAAKDAGMSADDFAKSANGVALAAEQAAEKAEHFAKAALDAANSFVDQSDQVHHVTDPTSVFAAQAKAAAASGGALGQLLGGFDLNHLSADDISKIDKQLGDLFDQLHNSPGSVDTAGLSIQDLIDEILKLDSAAQAAAQSLDSTNSALSDDFDVFGTTATDQAKQRASAYGIDISQYDLSTQTGVNSLISALQSDYGNTTDVTQKEKDKALIDNLRQIQFDTSGGTSLTGGASSLAGTPSATTVSASGFQAATTVQADQMLNELRVQTGYLAILARVAQAGGGVAGIGSVGGVGAGSSSSASRALDASLGRTTLLQRTYEGNITVPR